MCSQGEPEIRGEEGEPIPLATLADRLMGIADELRCAHYLDGFAEQIDALAEEVERRQELDERMEKVRKRMAKSPAGISERWFLRNTRRDRRFQEDMRNILKAGGTTYRGKKIIGSEIDPFIERFTRRELLAEITNDLSNQLGVESTDSEKVID
jgi:hypothetical protein